MLNDQSIAGDPVSADFLPWKSYPRSVKFAFVGIQVALVSMAVGGIAIQIIELFVPVKGNGIPWWGWPLLTLIWIPGIVGILTGYYAIIRYPYLSMAIEWTPTLSDRRWLWATLGWIFYLLGALILLVAITQGTDDWVGRLLVANLGCMSIFGGFLLANFRADKHFTVATFIHLTKGIAILVLPLYLPALIWGSINCRRFLGELERSDVNDPQGAGMERATQSSR